MVVVGTTAAVFLVCLLALWIFAGPGRDASRREILIPAGTADLIAAGQNPLDLPSNWSFRSGDVLVLDNRDVADHYVGAWFAPYGEVTEVTMEASATVFCTLHPAGQIIIDVTPRRSDWALAVPPTLMIGPALGLVLLLALRLLRGLEEHGPAGTRLLGEAGVEAGGGRTGVPDATSAQGPLALRDGPEELQGCGIAAGPPGRRQGGHDRHEQRNQT